MITELLAKLDNVEIQTTDRFSPVDMEYCRQTEREYQQIHQIYSEVAFIIDDANSKIKSFPKFPYATSINECKKLICDCNENFIHSICRYFKEKYSVSINNPKWPMTETFDYEDDNDNYFDKKGNPKKYEIVPLSYILDDIYNQMGGLSFEEKGFNEVLAYVRSAVTTYKGEISYSLKGKKLIIDQFYWSHKCHIFNRYEATVSDHHKGFFKALSHYEYGYFDIAQKYDFLCGYDIKESNGVYDKHDISSSVISSLKVFKNGKLEIEFNDYDKAVKFVKTYLPGIPQNIGEAA
jgi:hypothetical protein